MRLIVLLSFVINLSSSLLAGGRIPPWEQVQPAAQAITLKQFLGALVACQKEMEHKAIHLQAFMAVDYRHLQDFINGIKENSDEISRALAEIRGASQQSHGLPYSVGPTVFRRQSSEPTPLLTRFNAALSQNRDRGRLLSFLYLFWDGGGTVHGRSVVSGLQQL
ncbi:MAG: hypothetical protein ACH349_07690 [Candidatus Rhabdochlamydia sp.]